MDVCSCSRDTGPRPRNSKLDILLDCVNEGNMFREIDLEESLKTLLFADLDGKVMIPSFTSRTQPLEESRDELVLVHDKGSGISMKGETDGDRILVEVSAGPEEMPFTLNDFLAFGRSHLASTGIRIKDWID